MANIFRKPRAGVGRFAFYLLIFAGSALAVNAWIFTGPAIEWSRSLTNPGWAPSGLFIGAVWMVQFSLLALSAFVIDRSGEEIRKDAARLCVVAWWLICLAWPGAYFLMQSVSNGVYMTLAALLFGIPALWLIRRASPLAALMLLPLQAWLVFALVLMVAVWRLNA